MPCIIFAKECLLHLHSFHNHAAGFRRQTEKEKQNQAGNDQFQHAPRKMTVDNIFARRHLSLI